MKSCIYLTIICLSVLSCHKTSLDPQPELVGLWRYASGIVEEHHHLFPEAYVRFDQSDHLTGKDSESEFTGRFQAEALDQSLRITEWINTDTAESKWSLEFKQVLESVDHYNITDQTLVLGNSTGQSLVFEHVENCKAARNNKSRYSNGRSDPFQILEMHQIEDCLEIVASYAGGCKAVTFELVGSGDYAESYPPQLNIRLLLEDDDDCEAQIIEFIHFDVKEIRYPGLDVLIFRLDGFDQFFRYEFGD